MEFVCAFAPAPAARALPDGGHDLCRQRPPLAAVLESGGAIDLSGSKDPRWKELERRIVLSQYLMAVNEAGSLPPQESGLVNNGWHGKFHMEMYWWHAAHCALWNRWPLLNRSLGIYHKFLPRPKRGRRHKGIRARAGPR